MDEVYAAAVERVKLPADEQLAICDHGETKHARIVGQRVSESAPDVTRSGP